MKPVPEKKHSIESSLRALTPARVFAARNGCALSTSDWLALRADHASARDAVFQESDPFLLFDDDSGLPKPLVVSSQAATQTDYLLRPDLGRKLFAPDRKRIQKECPKGVELQILLADGLSATALQKQGPKLLHSLTRLAQDEGWNLGRPIFLHRARVGILNDIGFLLEPKVCVLLIGERPGLSTAESLSAYLAYQPKSGDTDANRNLIASIYDGGIPIKEAARRILNLARTMKAARQSGVGIREELPSLNRPGFPDDSTLP